MTSIVAILLLLTQSSQRAEIEAHVKRMFEKDRRMKFMRLPDIVEKLGARKGSQIADVGCGPGGFSAVLGHVVGPEGRVYCVDKENIKEARTRISKEKLKNVKSVKAPAEDPKLPAGSLDAVLVVNAYHEFEKFAPALEKFREALKPGGRLVMIENVPRKVHTQPRKIQMDNHVMAAGVVEPEIKAAGFQIVERDDKFIDHPEDETVQWLMVATPAR